MPPAYAELELDGRSLDGQQVRATLERYNCLKIRRMASPALIAGILQRVKQVFATRQAELDAGQMLAPEGFGKTFKHGVVPYLGIHELDMPQGPPYQLLRMVEASPMMDVIRACVGSPVYCNVAESAARRMLADRPELYISYHQDGFFDHDPNRKLINCWIPLVPCGRDAPGIDLLPLGLKEMLPISSEEKANQLDYAFYNSAAYIEAHAEQIWRPIAEPGDILIWDALAVHGTYAHPLMPHPRYNLELRFTGGPGIPEDLKQEYGLHPVGGEA